MITIKVNNALITMSMPKHQGDRNGYCSHRCVRSRSLSVTFYKSMQTKVSTAITALLRTFRGPFLRRFIRRFLVSTEYVSPRRIRCSIKTFAPPIFAPARPNWGHSFHANSVCEVEGKVPLACKSAWYDERTMGPDATCKKPIFIPASRNASNSGGVT